MPLNGSDLLEVLEWSVYDYNESERKGKFLQYSGKQIFRYDIVYFIHWLGTYSLFENEIWEMLTNTSV